MKLLVGRSSDLTSRCCPYNKHPHNQVSFQKKIVTLFLGVKPPGREADCSPSFSAEVKMNESIPPISLMSLLLHFDACGR